MKRTSTIGPLLLALVAPLLAAPSLDTESPSPTYPTRFVDAKTGKPISGVFVYVDVPGDNAVKLEQRFFLAKADGSGPKTFANCDLNVYLHLTQFDKSVIETKNESDFTKVNTGEPVDGVLVVKLPSILLMVKQKGPPVSTTPPKVAAEPTIKTVQ